MDASSGKPRILIVDDVPANIKILNQALRDEYKISVAVDGAEALRLSGNAPAPDLVLLDIKMPGLDGYEVLGSLKADPKTRDIPVMFITSLNEEGEEARGLEQGAADYITKPFSLPIVRARVQTAIRLKREADTSRNLAARLSEVNAELAEMNEHLEQRVAQRTSELQTALGELESLSYSMAHDLRTPLRSIDGFSQLLLEDYNDVLDPEGREHLARVRQASQKLGRLFDDFQDLILVTRAAMDRERFDVGETAGEAAKILSSAMLHHVRFTAPRGVVVNADRNLVSLLLTHLLANAFKFSSVREKPEVVFDALSTPDGRTFFVRDNGVGFDKAYVHKLFAPMNRLHSPEDFEGAGMGLAIAQRVVRRHGGKIWAEGESGKGATFYFTLPE